MDTSIYETFAPVAPPHDCALCPRLCAHRAEAGGHGPVASRGPVSARVLVVGLAPDAAGDDGAANRTLYQALHRLGMAQHPGDAEPPPPLSDTRVTHTVRCAPPDRMPDPVEVRTCNQYLAGELATLPNLRAVLALGALAHAAVLSACGIPPARIRFVHGMIHLLPDGLIVADCDGIGGALGVDALESNILALLKYLETAA